MVTEYYGEFTGYYCGFLRNVAENWSESTAAKKKGAPIDNRSAHRFLCVMFIKLTPYAASTSPVFL